MDINPLLQIVEEPPRSSWPALLRRPVMNWAETADKVRPVLKAVAAEGDAALLRFTEMFDGVRLKQTAAENHELAEAEARVGEALKKAIRQAAANIEQFHRQQLQSPKPVETMPGVTCWRKQVGIEKVGIYIPGGTAPLLSTVLMLAVPARLAGCREIVLCTPPQPDGGISPAILFAAATAGVTKIFKAGGAQAIAAMAYGTESVPAVYKIYGPGNQYVTAAKMLVQQEAVAIDLPAGPSEVCVMADATANPAYVAADLLSQAEHGSDSQVLLVAAPGFHVQELQDELSRQLSQLPRRALAAEALANSKVILFRNEADMLDLVNAYAPEHLIISMRDAVQLSERIINAGSVFIGHYSPESVGDYASGTNHTLPTNGYAAMYSGVSVDSFVRQITFQQLTPEGLQAIAPTVIAMAEAEGLEAHARAVSIRLNKS